MATDDLTRPLGLSQAKVPGRGHRFLKISAGGLAALSAMTALWFVLGRDPENGDPAIVAAIDGGAVRPPETSAKPPPDAAHPSATTSRSGTQGGLSELVPDGRISDIGRDSVVISDPNDPALVRLAAAPIEDLTEQSPYGLLPRIAPDGTRPMDAYARPVGAQASGRPRQLAIVVGGIGIAENGTDAAIADLPGAVTLALAPYGDNLPRILARSRAAGHEIILQVPLEPYGYPNNNPGPHTLTLDASAEENIDRLHWLMSRITTYVGVTNYLGARFTSEETALAPVIAEVGKRGLLYLDDGSSGASRAGRLANDRTPFARADVVLDAVTEDDAIDARLAQAEAIALKRGYAIATATAFPVTIERIAEYAASAADRGIEIVPVSAIVNLDRK